VLAAGHGQRQHGDHPFTRKVEALPARHQQHRVGAGPEYGAGEDRRRVEHVLAVVEHHEHAIATAQPLEDHLFERDLRTLAHPEGGGDGGENELGGDRHHVDESAPAGEEVGGLGDRFGGQPGFPHPAGADQRDEPAGRQGLGQVSQLGGPADEGAPVDGESHDFGGGRRSGRHIGWVGSRGGHPCQVATIGGAQLAQ
jgi:hypothetical protein